MFRLKDRQKCQQLFERYYAGRKFKEVLYRELIKEHLRPGQRLLDAGCGRYLKVCKEMSGVANVVGVDLETLFETDNSQAPFGVRGDVGHLPLPSNHFDMVISRSVVEHLEDPPRVFREFYRVLKPGGKVVILTPNKYDYVSVIAAFTPYWLHRSLVSNIFQVPGEDVFPTLYRANTLSSLSAALSTAGLVKRHLETINHYPAYLAFSPLLYRAGILYEKLTSLRAFRSLRGSLLCVFEKPARSAQERSREAASNTTLEYVNNTSVEVT